MSSQVSDGHQFPSFSSALESIKTAPWSPRSEDVIRRCFSLPSPNVTFLVRQVNREKCEVATPKGIDLCFEELERQFGSGIEASVVTNACIPGSKLRLNFHKVKSISVDAAPSLLNVYIYAVDQVDSRPRFLHSAVREWQSTLKNSNDGSCLVMLYHQDLVDATSPSVLQAAALGDRKMPDQRKAEAAAASLGPYFDELGAMKFGPQQMCSYLPHEAPTRLVERLSAAYRDVAKNLTNIFNACLQRKSAVAPNSEASPSQSALWCLQDCWRKGYDLAVHYLQFGVVSKAMATFARMFDMYYYHSDDFPFMTKNKTVEQLLQIPDMFSPSSFPYGGGIYPSVLEDGAEPGAGLLFIVVCQVRCALLLEKKDLAFARFRLFLQLSREKFMEEAESYGSGNPPHLVLLLRFAISALQTNWCSGVSNGSDARQEVSLSSIIRHKSSPDQSQQRQSNQQTPTLSQPAPLHIPVQSFTSPDKVTTAWSTSFPSEGSCTTLSVCEDYGDFERDLGPKIDELYSPLDSATRLDGLCKALKIGWVGRNTQWADNSVFVQLSDEVLQLFSEVGILLGYTETGEKKTSTPTQTFGVAEVDTIDNFISFYRMLTEAAALFSRLLNNKHREHALLYKLARSYSVTEPSRTAALCCFHLIPFVRHHGWLQLQVLVHRLYVESMDRIMAQRRESGQILLSKEEGRSMEESYLCIISAFGEREPLRREVVLLCGAPCDALMFWRRLKLLMVDVSFYTSQQRESADAPSSSSENGEDLAYGVAAEGCLSISKVIRGEDIYFSLIDPSRGRPEASTANELASSAQCTASGDCSGKGSDLHGCNFPGGTACGDKGTSCRNLQAKISETVFLCFEALCPIDMLAANDAFEDEQLQHESKVAAPISAVATLVSKKDWGDEDEVTHIVEVRKMTSSHYSAETQQLQWVWEFNPCHTGGYRLLDITLHVGSCRLVYDDFTSSCEPYNYFAHHSVWTNSCLPSTPPPCLLTVQDVESGLSMRLEPPKETHCFADSVTFFDVHIEMGMTLQQLVASTDINVEKVGDCAEKNGSGSVQVNSCRFEATHPNTAACLDGQYSTDTGNLRKHILERRSSLSSTMVPTNISSQHDSQVLAYLLLSRPKGYPALRTSKDCISLMQSLSHDASNNPAQNLMEPIVWSINRDEKTDHTLLLVCVKHDTNGTYTMVPINEGFFMTQLPPIHYGVEEKKSCSGSGVSDGTKAAVESVTSVRLEGNILTHLKQQCCFRICRNEDSRGVSDVQEQKAGIDENVEGSSCSQLSHSNSLHLSLPLIPLYMTFSEECAHMSFRSVGVNPNCGDRKVSVSIPFKMSAAFQVRYTFKCSQGRVYCLVWAKNVLKETSLWLRGAILELIDGDLHYELSRISSTHEQIMTREWKPGESVHLLFELAPSFTAQTQLGEKKHDVRIKLLYSNWSVTETLKPLRNHILLPKRHDIKKSTSNSGGMRSDLMYMSNAGEPLDDLIEQEPECSTRDIRLRYDLVQLEKMYASCNTFSGHVGSFTYKYSCWFNVYVTALPSPWYGKDTFVNSGLSSVDESCLSLGNEEVFTHGTVTERLPASSSFTVGEPVRFAVTLDPLAHNWPEGSEAEEDFVLLFKVDPASWFVLGKQRLRRKLSIMEKSTVYFTALPLPPSTTGGDVNVSKYQNPRNCHHHDKDEGNNAPSAAGFKVATPTIEVHRALSPGNHDMDSGKDNSLVHIEVIQFCALMQVEHR
uniref:Trafficking protein particle complex subunit 10 n=1 Tax=Trypanosoma congolense (strain IL3000) TaxID=1068625 RepID=G0V0L3_TRYCI|nr:conserved hypothetical protein [Trypanosoma congolense IL3000]